MRDEQRSPLFLALDCGYISPEEVIDFETAPAYKRARAVWQAIHTEVMLGAGEYVSARTMMNYEHWYILGYGQDMPFHTKLHLFRVMDRFRQQWLHEGLPGPLGFVQFQIEAIEEMFAKRAETIKSRQHLKALRGEGELHERHEPQVVAIQQSDPPIPIDPPFESIPLYYEEKHEQEQPKQPRASSKKSFLERYLTSLRLDYEQEEQAMHQQGVEQSSLRKLQAVGQAMILTALESRKYRFTRSAMAMAHALMSEGTSIKTLPGQAIFIEFPEPLQFAKIDPIAGLAFMQPFTSYQRWVEQDRQKRTKIFGEEFRTKLWHLWGVNVLAEDGGSLFNLVYDSSVQRWRVPEVRQCLVGECIHTMSPDEMLARGEWTNWQLCPTCTALLIFFSHWIPIALLMIDGEFAEEQEAVQREVEETVTYKERRVGSGKYDEKKQEARWRIVSFDASVRTPDRGSLPKEHQEGPSWLDRAIAKGTVVYVKRGFGKSTRHLDPARHPRWKSKRDVTVRGYERRVPMTVANLQKVITKVVASTYAEKE